MLHLCMRLAFNLAYLLVTTFLFWSYFWNPTKFVSYFLYILCTSLQFSKPSLCSMTKQYFFDLKEESDHSKMGSEKQSSGCHVSWGIAFILVLLSVLVAVVVGLIVHFAERDSYDRDITCTFPESLTAFFQKFQGWKKLTWLIDCNSISVFFSKL